MTGAGKDCKNKDERKNPRGKQTETPYFFSPFKSIYVKENKIPLKNSRGKENFGVVNPDS